MAPLPLTPFAAAKQGATPLLAVATEQGTVHVLNTSKRKDWDFGELAYVHCPLSLLTIHH